MSSSVSTLNKTIRVWDMPVRLFHWLLVASILVAFLSAEEDSLLSAWHVSAGWIAAILIAFRLVWGFVGGRYARFANFVRPGLVIHHIKQILLGQVELSVGHNPLGGLAVLILLGGTAFVSWTGYQLSVGGGEEELHEVVAFAFLALIALHIVAVLLMSILTQENLLKAMVTGRKQASLHPRAMESEPLGPLAYVAGALAITGSVAAVQKIDATAFDLQGAREDSEEQGGAVEDD